MSTWFNLTRTHTGSGGTYKCDLHPTDITAIVSLSEICPQLNWYIDEDYVQLGSTSIRITLEGLLYPVKFRDDFIDSSSLEALKDRLLYSLEYYKSDASDFAHQIIILFQFLHSRGIGLHVSY